jgi:predicted TIM-barrel fold metal-dependent hydrolase
MCFPTFAEFSAGHLSKFKDEITVAMISAYNDWHVDEWFATYPGRFIPNAILPLRDTDLAVAEITRVVAEGFRAVTIPELPHIDGLSNYHDGDTGPRYSRPSPTPAWS